MVTRTILLVAVTFISSAGSSQEMYRPPPDDSAARAAAFMRTLVSQSPDHDGVPLRDYAISDVDFDGKFEVLESINELEEKATGFLADANYLPCVWVNVYRERDGRFILATGDFTNFLTRRQVLYEHWLAFIRATGTDSQGTKACADAGLWKIAELRARKP